MNPLAISSDPPALSTPSTNTIKHSCDRAVQGQCTVEVVRNLLQLESIRSFWIASQRNPNSDIDFYRHVIGLRPEAWAPFVVVLYREGQPEAILIGRTEDVRLECKVGYKTLFALKARQLTFIHQGQLGNLDQENCAVIIKEIRRCLHAGEADLAEYHFIRRDSHLYSSLNDTCHFSSRDYAPVSQRHWSSTLPTDGAGFIHGLSPKVRKNLKWQAKKVLQDFQGNVRVECFDKPEGLRQGLIDIERIAGKTYQRGLGVGFVNHGEISEIVAFQAEMRWLRAYVLYIQNVPAAFWIGTCYLHTFHSNYMGYDPKYTSYSPGMYLILKSVEHLSAGHSDINRIDWGLGDAQYKKVLGDSCWSDVSLCEFAPTIHGIALNAMRTPAAVTDKILRTLSTNWAVGKKIKKTWRKHLRQG